MTQTLNAAPFESNPTYPIVDCRSCEATRLCDMTDSELLAIIRTGFEDPDWMTKMFADCELELRPCPCEETPKPHDK